MSKKRLEQMREEFSTSDLRIAEFDLCEEYDGVTWLWGHGRYGPSSVLAGGQASVRLQVFDTAAEAKAAYPHIPLSRHVPVRNVSVPDIAPPGFDPLDAGEQWEADPSVGEERGYYG